jgi:hypothetical protein
LGQDMLGPTLTNILQRFSLYGITHWSSLSVRFTLR